ncbi:hypothetical protein G3O08_02325 [Cryomorpha ignava]|uniref:Uncharacterized protein n=1 Tax=Cryomorpha ignava TaxID=101383 RepID=A0A7K3WLD5_9FLAO|nr:hypothetical protein [Cryomorpha ignava]NEN22338.1 hypothetical protein [Cryomorpha ignava]
MGIKIAYYKKSDWDRVTKTMDDREKMHDTWQEWHKEYLKVKINFIKKGFKVVVVEVNPDELMLYCAIRGIKNTSAVRSQFVQDK